MVRDFSLASILSVPFDPFRPPGYVIGFTPAKSADGKRHSLMVMIDRANLKVRTRNAYVAASTECKPDANYPGFSCVY
jgi:hypothetical protein